MDSLPFGPGSFYTLHVQESSDEPPRPVRESEILPKHTPELQKELHDYINYGRFPPDGGSSDLSPKPPGQYPQYTFRSLTPSQEYRSHSLSRLGEIAFVQWAALEKYTDCKKIGSCLHAGPGQRIWGGFAGDRIDFSCHQVKNDNVNVIKFINYHEANIHYSGHYSLRNQRDDDDDDDNGELFCWESGTKFKDHRRRLYTEIMNEAMTCGGYEPKTKFEYKVFTECEIFHENEGIMGEINYDNELMAGNNYKKKKIIVIINPNLRNQIFRKVRG